MTKQRNSTKASALAGMPPEVAAILQQRGDLPPAAVDAIEPAKTADAALAKLEAMTAELAASTGTKLTQHSEAVAAVANITAPATTAAAVPAPTAPTATDRVVRIHQRPNPNSRYIDLPPEFADFIQQNVQADDHGIDLGFSDVAGYYTAHHGLTQLIQTLPASVPSPLGWEISGSGSVDVVDILRGSSASRHPEMLSDLVRWALTVQQAQKAGNARSALNGLQQRGERSDERLAASSGTALLNKFNMLVSLLQTQAFSGKPELLAKCLLADWDWLEHGVAYKTPLAELNGYPALFNSSSMTPAAFTGSGSLASFMQQHSNLLIDAYREATSLRDPQFGSISIAVQQKHAWIQAERTQASADSPVVVQLGYQEQLANGSSIDQYGSTEGWRDITALTMTQDGDSLTIQTGNIPSDSAVAAPVRDAVRALQLLNDAQK